MTDMQNNKPMRSIERSIPIALLRAREAVMAHFRPLLADRGYTEQQWRVLRILNEYGALEVTQLAEHSALLMPSLTRILKTLEEKQSIYRIRDECDGRRSLIHLSENSKTLIKQEAARTEAAYAVIEASFGAAKTNQLLDLLTELAAVAPPLENKKTPTDY